MAERGTTAAAPVAGRWQQTFIALKYRNYRLWFIGQMISMFGTWMQSTAQGYLMYELTGSPAFLGYVTFVTGIPSWVLMLYGGVIADRVPRKTLLLITQFYMMALALILATLAFLNIVQPWHILVLAFCLGISNAFDAPARQAFVLEMVDRADLGNAIALNSAMFTTATVIGPAASGLIYALFGPAWCFLFNAFTYFGVIGALLLMKLKPMEPRRIRASALSDLKEGLRYVAADSTIRGLMLLTGVSSLFGFSIITLFPSWAVDVLGGDVTTNGLMQSARGVGALAGAMLIASTGRTLVKGRMMTIGTFVFPCALLAFALARWLPVSLLTLVVVGMGLILIFNLANTLLQTVTSDHLRGRVMAAYALTFFGLNPIGGLWVGTMADRVGEPTTAMISAAVLFAMAVAYWFLFPRLRTIH